MSRKPNKLVVTVLCIFFIAVTAFAADTPKDRGTAPKFLVTKPSADYLQRLKAAYSSSEDYFWESLAARTEEPNYEGVKDFLGPL